MTEEGVKANWFRSMYAHSPASPFGKPAPIPIPGARLGGNGRNYDITPDGKHFIRDRAGIHGKCRGPAVPRNKSTLF
jgi:hypothetical protein